MNTSDPSIVFSVDISWAQQLRGFSSRNLEIIFNTTKTLISNSLKAFIYKKYEIFYFSNLEDNNPIKKFDAITCLSKI